MRTCCCSSRAAATVLVGIGISGIALWCCLRMACCREGGLLEEGEDADLLLQY
jgi:hypothetical protein